MPGRGLAQFSVLSSQLFFLSSQLFFLSGQLFFVFLLSNGSPAARFSLWGWLWTPRGNAVQVGNSSRCCEFFFMVPIFAPEAKPLWPNAASVGLESPAALGSNTGRHRNTNESEDLPFVCPTAALCELRQSLSSGVKRCGILTHTRHVCKMATRPGLPLSEPAMCPFAIGSLLT